jgi:hypothetical protein
MKILNYSVCIKLNLLLLIILTIECLKLSSNSKTETTNEIKSNLSNSFELKIKSKISNTNSKLNLQTKLQSKLQSKNKLISQKTNTNTNTKTNLQANLQIKTNTHMLSSSKLTTSDCNPLCNQCSYTDRNYCTVCKTGIILFSFSCVETCPLGTYLNQASGTCNSCHQDCPICWGPEKDNCGTIAGVKGTVVSLENEIIDFFHNHIFVKDEVDQWICSLKTIFRDPNDEIIYPLFADKNPEFNVYLNEKGNVEAPIGSFGFAGGLFVPIPPYINREKKLIESHWIYKKGTWDGFTWHDEFYPRLPTFIQYKGSKDKIYLENNGMWIFDVTSQWVYIKSIGSIPGKEIILDKMNNLNKIKFDVKNNNIKIISI